MLGRQGERVSVSGGTADEVSLACLVIAVSCSAKTRSGLEAVIVFLQDDIDDTADGIRAVNGRGSVLEDFDAVNHRRRDRIEVHDCAGLERRPCDALTVDQDKGGEIAQSDI